MTGQGDSTERQRNLWAPWRMEYIRELADGHDDCFLCRYRQNPAEDVRQLVLWRRPLTMTVMNRFPYTTGHLMVAPLEHKGQLAELDEPVLTELMTSLRDAQTLLGRVVRPDGFNVGINFGRCAGAGLPGHLHLHIVPRWEGDTNFMAVLGDVRVIPRSLDELYAALRTASRELGFADGG